MIVGASTGALYPTTLTEDAVDRLAGLGFERIEILLQTAGEHEPAFARLLDRRVRAAGIVARSVHTFTSLLPFYDPYSRRRDEAFARFQQVVDLSAVIGATHIVLHGPRRREATSEAEWPAFSETLARLAATADEAGVLLTVENVSWCLVRDVETVERLRSWRLPVGLTFDPFQAAEAGADPVTLLNAIGESLANVHLSDYAVDPEKLRHLPIGEGILDFPAILNACQKTGYDGPLILETSAGDDMQGLITSRRMVIEMLAEVV